MAIRSHRSASLDVPLCLRMMSTTEFLMRMQSQLYSAGQLGDQDSTWRIAVHALCQTAQTGPDQPWLLPIYLFYCIPRLLARVGPQETLLIDSLARIITSALRLSLCIDKSMGLEQPEPSNMIAERFSILLKKGSVPAAMTSNTVLLKSMQMSQPFCLQFPSFV